LLNAEVEDAFRVVKRYVTHYNEVRLHAALGYVTPVDRMANRHQEIWRERDHKLEAARERRRVARRKALQSHKLKKTMAVSEAGR
jgi:putative transposase